LLICSQAAAAPGNTVSDEPNVLLTHRHAVETSVDGVQANVCSPCTTKRDNVHYQEGQRAPPRGTTCTTKRDKRR
jgi:hypothetical protein